jgi:hypothetical protein
MDDQSPAAPDLPQGLLNDLAASDADLAAGRVVTGDGLMARIDQALARMAAKAASPQQAARRG